MNSSLTSGSKKHDWGMVFLGVLTIICAFIIMLWPNITLVTMALFAGFMLLFSAGSALATFMNLPKGTTGRGWIMANALLDILLGGMFIIHPMATSAVLPWLAGGFIIAYGIMSIVSSIGLKSLGIGWLIMLLNGILSIVIGFMFFANPASFVIFVGLFLIMRGAVMCVSGLIAPRNLPYN